MKGYNMKHSLMYEYVKKEKAIMNRLKSVVQDFKELAYTIPADQVEGTDALGCLVSKFVEWDGDDIFQVAYKAFEDSNCHNFNAEFLDLWEKPNYDKNLQKELSI